MLNLKSENNALEAINKLEAAIFTWKEKIAEQSDGRSPVRRSWSFLKDPIIEMDRTENLLNTAEMLLQELKSKYPNLPQTFLDVVKVQYGKVHRGSRFDAFSSIISEEKLPTFNGSSLKLDFLDWFDMFEDYFEAVNPPDAVKCKLVASKLKGESRIWWKELQNNPFSKGKNLITSWSRMRELLLKRILHTSHLTYIYKQENEDSVKHTKCSTKFPNQLNKQEEAETIEYLQADGFIPPNCSTTCLSGVHRNCSLEENNVCEMVGDLCHNAKMSRTKVSNIDNGYSEENNEGPKTIKHAKQEGADGIKNIHANKSTPSKYSIESPFESVNGKQPGSMMVLYARKNLNWLCSQNMKSDI